MPYRSLAVLFFIFTTLALPVRAATILDVPFSPQAPQNQWRTQPFADACEETSVIMAEAFYTNTPLTPKSVRARILNLAAYEQKYFGFQRDTNSTYTARMANERAKMTAIVVENPTIEEIKAQIDASRPVIYLAYSPALKNPHYNGSGNPYHVLLIIGYDDETQEFITNDPGTRFGKAYRYPIDRLMAANHDFQKPNLATGAARMIFTAPQN